MAVTEEIQMTDLRVPTRALLTLLRRFQFRLAELVCAWNQEVDSESKAILQRDLCEEVRAYRQIRDPFVHQYASFSKSLRKFEQFEKAA